MGKYSYDRRYSCDSVSSRERCERGRHAEITRTSSPLRWGRTRYVSLFSKEIKLKAVLRHAVGSQWGQEHLYLRSDLGRIDAIGEEREILQTVHFSVRPETLGLNSVKRRVKSDMSLMMVKILAARRLTLYFVVSKEWAHFSVTTTKYNVRRKAADNLTIIELISLFTLLLTVFRPNISA